MKVARSRAIRGPAIDEAPAHFPVGFQGEDFKGDFAEFLAVGEVEDSVDLSADFDSPVVGESTSRRCLQWWPAAILRGRRLVAILWTISTICVLHLNCETCMLTCIKRTILA